jgi:hypothetical protein
MFEEFDSNKFSKGLIKSLGEAADHAEGRASSARVHVVEVPDVRAIRRKLATNQSFYFRTYWRKSHNPRVRARFAIARGPGERLLRR